jgi:hypothetical protein
MKKLFFTLMLVSICSNVGAEWVYVAETEKDIKRENSFIAYADPATIRKTGNLVKMWSLYDYKLPQKSGVISARQKSEYNCIEKKRRQLFLSAYSGRMNNGETLLIYNQPEDDWERSPLGSVRKAMLEFACGWHPKLPPRNFFNITVAETVQ